MLCTRHKLTAELLEINVRVQVPDLTVSPRRPFLGRCDAAQKLQTYNKSIVSPNGVVLTRCMFLILLGHNQMEKADG